MHLALPETADFMAAELSRENLEDNIATAEGGVKREADSASLYFELLPICGTMLIRNRIVLFTS